MTNKIFGEAPGSVIHFRNPHAIAPVIIQMFMLLAAFLIILGLFYVLCLVVAITIHHFIYDRVPENVPDFVKNSIQFSSSEESEDDIDHDGRNSSDPIPKDSLLESTKSTKFSRNQSKVLAETARKAQNLDKFLYNEERGG